MIEKAWPIVLRNTGGAVEVLAFQHPRAGKQFVKGTIEQGETPANAAIRELYEESGIVANKPLRMVGEFKSVQTGDRWHFFLCETVDLPKNWAHQTEDDFGHKFSFFWQPLGQELEEGWHPIFHEALQFFAPLCKALLPT